MRSNSFSSLLLSLGLISALPARADDKSATREGLVKLPASGGTVQKDDSSFGFSSSRGTASYTIPLPELPSRGKMKPSLSLSYSQSSGDSGSGLGIGWSISHSAIAFNDDLGTALRQRRGDNGDFSSHLSLDGQRLIPHLSNQQGEDYQYSLEASDAFKSIRYTKTASRIRYLGPQGEERFYDFPGGFIVRNGSGKKSYYPESSDSAEVDPNDAAHVVRWPLVAEIDARGESIFYSYKKHKDRSYLDSVSFAGGQSIYSFERIETRPSLLSYRAAFQQVNGVLYGGVSASFRGQLQSQICMAFIGRDSSSDRFAVRSGKNCATRARSDLAELTDQASNRSLNVLDQLKVVYRFGQGQDFSDANQQSILRFDYSNWNESDSSRNIVFPAEALAQVNAATNFELFDYNLDAIVDLIKADAQKVEVAFGDDDITKSFERASAWLVERDGRKLRPQLGSSAWHFVEINGDTLTDLLEIENGVIHAYIRKDDGSFLAAHDLEIPWINPGLFQSRTFRWMDLNNDGMTDLIGTEVQGSNLVFKIAINQTLRMADGSFDYYFLESNRILPYKAPLGNLLADERILFSDINGDQLQDLIRLRPDRSGLCIYENKGDVYADTAQKLFGSDDGNILSVNNCEGGKFVSVDGLHNDIANGSRRIWFLDANGDGILDLVNFTGDDSALHVWLGFGNGEFLKEPLKFSTLDEQGQRQVSVQAGRDLTRVADIDGDGQAELVIFQIGQTGLKPVVTIDFNRLQETQLIKSNLLTTVENSSGLRYDMRFASSIDELQRDRAAGRNSSALNFPMYLVKQLVISEADPEHPGSYKPGREVKEMLYHNPVFDRAAKKLVGFENVETISYGDEFLGEREQSQLSSYRLEIFENDYRMAGEAKEVYVHEFSPNGYYGEQSLKTHNLALKGAALHSIKDLAKAQELAVPGKLLSSELSTHELVQKEEGYDGEYAYYRRTPRVEKRLHGSGDRISSVIQKKSDYDAFNLARIQEESRTAVKGPADTEIPYEASRTETDYAKSRAHLSALGIINLPSRVTLSRADGVRFVPAGQQDYEYDSKGLEIKDTKKVFALDTDSIPEYQASADQVTGNSYDVFGNPTSESLNGILLESVIYDATGSLPREHRNAVGHKTTMYYGSEAAALCPDRPSSFRPLEGALASYRDSRGLCHYYGYDQFARRAQYRRADGYEEKFQYAFAKEGKPSFILRQGRRSKGDDAKNFLVTLEAYSAQGARVANMERLEEGEGVRVVAYEEHNRKKNQARLYTPFKDESTSLEEIFANGRIPTAGKDSAIRTAFDALDRPILRQFPAGKIERASYEPWGQILSSTYSLGRGRGDRTVTRSFVQADKKVHAIIDERQGVQKYSYDLFDNISEIWMPGETTVRSYKYDSLGRKLQQCAPGIGCSSFQYDVLGQVSAQFIFDAKGKASGRLSYFYDVLGRLQEVYDGEHLIAKNQYDRYPEAFKSQEVASAIGLQTVSQSFDGNKLYDQTKILSYDLAGRVIERKVQVDGAQAKSFSERFKYTLDGALEEAEDPFGVRSFYTLSPTLRFTRLEMELPWQRGKREVIVDKITYSARGQVEQIAYRNSAYTNLAYDPKTLQLKQIQTSYRKADGNQELLQNAALEFNGNNSLAEIIDSVPANTSYGAVNRSAKFDYNERDELVRAERYGEVQEYAYDLSGHLTANGEHDNDLVYAYDDQGRLKTRQYNGSLKSTDPLEELQKRRKVQETRFNSLGQLVYVKTDSKEIFYGYDAEGIRHYKRVKDIGALKVADSLFPSKTVTIEPTGAQSFVFVGTRRLARIDHENEGLAKGRWFYYLLDHLGSTDFTMTEDGMPIEQMLYRAYGTEPLINELSQGKIWKKHQQVNASLLPKERTHHRFAGQYLDDDSGLYYMGARYYDPALGRFISPDPLFLSEPKKCAQSTIECNLYSYAANNPLKYIDPTGFEIKDLTDDQWKAVSEARDTAVKDLGTITGALGKSIADPKVQLPPKIKEGLEKYLGIKPDAKTKQYDPADLKKANEGLTKLKDHLNGMTRDNFKYDNDTKASTGLDGVFAWVRGNDGTKMMLSDKFFSAPKTGQDNRSGIIVHEGSHYTATMGTKDKHHNGSTVYGPTKAAQYAKDKPGEAMTNGDNIEYFYEHATKK